MAQSVIGGAKSLAQVVWIQHPRFQLIYMAFPMPNTAQAHLGPPPYRNIKVSS